MPESIVPKPSYAEYMRFKDKIAVFLCKWREVNNDNRRYIERGTQDTIIGPFSPAYIGMVVGLDPDKLNSLLPLAKRDGLLTQSRTEGDIYGDITFLRAQDLIEVGQKLLSSRTANRIVYVAFIILAILAALLLIIGLSNRAEAEKSASEAAAKEESKARDCNELKLQVREASGWEYQTLGYRYWHNCSE